MTKASDKQIIFEKFILLASSLFTSVALARKLGVESYGIYASILASTTIFLKFSTVGSSTYLNTLASHDNLSYTTYRKCWKISLAGSILTLIMSLIFISWSNPTLIAPSLIVSISYILSTKNILHALYIGQGRYSIISKSVIIESISRTFFILIFICIDSSIVVLFIFLCIPQLLSYAYIWAKRIDSVRSLKASSCSKHYTFKDILKVSIVLMLGTGLLGLYSSLPIIIISQKMNYDIAALFSIYTASALFIINWFSAKVSNDQKNNFTLTKNMFFLNLWYIFRSSIMVSFLGSAALYVLISFAYGSTYYTSPFVILSLTTFILVKLLSVLDGQRLKFLRKERLGFVRYIVAIILFLISTILYPSITADLNLLIYCSSISLLLGIVVSCLSTFNARLDLTSKA